jgi:probable HAF family extracellular repeat protein
MILYPRFVFWTFAHLSFVLTAQAAGPYRLTDLADLPDGLVASRAFAVNELGEVAGGGTVGVGIHTHAFLWTATSGMQDLGTLVGPALKSEARGVNNRGEVVGYSDSPTNGTRAFLWTRDGAPNGGPLMRDLGELPGGLDQSFAYGINEHGQVVGTSEAATGSRAFLWTPTSGPGGTPLMQDLGDLQGGTGESFGNALNRHGHVVGWSEAAAGRRAFLWKPGEGMQDLGVLPGGVASFANDINDNGEVVGYSFAPLPRAFVWNSVDGMQDLGALGNFSEAAAINNRGDIIGLTGGGPFIWTREAGMQSLQTLLDPTGAGWRLDVVTAINETGQIVGGGTAPDGTPRAILLTPIPEPSTLALFVCVLSLVALCASRRHAVG